MSVERPILWQTKVHRPHVTSTVIQRARLLHLMDSGLDHRLILVCAPAGFGKTTLVSSWIEHLAGEESGAAARWPVAWLSLEEADSDLLTFLKYFISAIRTIFEDACLQTYDLLQARRLPPLKVMAKLLSNEIDRLPADFILVLDDFHTVRDEAVSSLLSELLLHWPRPLHLVLTARTNPSLPLARLRANDRLTEIRTHDLRFTPEESRQFLNQILPMPVSDRVLNALQDKVEGWIGAMRLVATSLRGQRDIDARLAQVHRPPAALVDYLVEEILDKQPRGISQFLLRTSILDGFCGPLCEAVSEEFDTVWDARSCIEWLVTSTSRLFFRGGCLWRPTGSAV